MRLIDADKTIGLLKTRLYETALNNATVNCDASYLYTECADNRIAAWINEQPTVEAEPVVQCKDCESWGLNVIKKDEKGEVIYGDCLHFCLATPKWFYCAWGERREDDTD